MAKYLRWWMAPLAFAALIFFPRLGACPFWDDDESFFAAAAHEMFVRSDLVTPTFNGQMFSHKPPVMFWGMMLGFQAFGVNEFSARLPSVLWGLAAVLGLALLVRRLLGESAAVWAGCILASSLLFVVVARAATPDAALTACFTLVFVAASLSFFASDGRLQSLKLQGRPWFFCYALMGLAILVKGPIGVVLPAGILMLFSMWQRLSQEEQLQNSWALCSFKGAALCWKALAESWRDLALTRGTLLAGIVAAPWFVAVTAATDGAWLADFLGVHNIGRFLKPMERHSGGPLYYVLATLVGFFPWSCFTLPLLLSARPRQGSAQAPALRFLWAWIFVVFAFFSAAATKLPSYVLPGYPALAALAAHYFLQHRAGLTWRFWPRWGFASLLAVGIGMCVVLPVVAHLYLGNQFAVMLLPLVVVCGGGAGCYLAWRASAPPAQWTLAITAFLAMVTIFHVIAPAIAVFSTAPQLALQARNALQSGGSLVGYCYREPSIVYYSGALVEQVSVEEGLLVSMRKHEDQPLFVAALASSWHRLSEETKEQFTQEASYRRFLQDEELLLLRRKQAPTARVATAKPSANKDEGPTEAR